jgi:PAS domain S-box-containing protein
VWLRRHHALLTILWLHVPALTIFAITQGYSFGHALLHGLPVASLGVLAMISEHNRRFSSAVVSFGLISCSALLVHTWHGVIEGHFHFFVMIALLALYEDWVPFLLAGAYVVVHHGLMGAIDPAGVYNHPEAAAHPWKWAAIHGGFVTAAALASVTAWRLNEDVRAEKEDAFRQAQASEERFRSAFDEAPNGIVLSGIEGEGIGRMLQVNRSMCKLLGYSKDDLIGSHFSEITHPSDMGKSTEMLEKLLAGEIPSYRVEKRYRHADGQSIWAMLNASLVRDDDGNPRFVIAQVEDITERKQAVAAMSESQRQLAEAQKLAHIGSWEWDIASGSVSWSEELFRIFGFEPGSHAPTYAGFLERIHPAERDRVHGVVQASAESGEPFHDEYPVIRPNGEHRIIETHGEVVRGYDGEPVKLVGTAQDVTDRRAVERELQLQREAERDLQSRSEFLSRISHELRTPLNAILGFAQVLELGDLDEDEKQSVRQILKGGTHLLELINEVLEISRVDSGNMSVSLESVSVPELVSDVLDLVGPLATQHDVTLHNQVNGGAPPHVEADKQRLKQVLLNLLSNGIKYNREGGSVTVSLEAEPAGRVAIKVRDTGQGIPADNLAHVFSPFNRLGAEQTSIEGTGLGLTLSKLLVEAMGGTLGVESEPDVGSTFAVGLAVGEAIDDGARVAGSDSAVAAGPRPPIDATILYVEDNLSNFKLVERLLVDRASVRLLTAMDGNLGLELARQHQPDLILLDLHLPVMDGPELLRRLKAEPVTSSIPVVIVSADATPARVQEMLDAGAAAFLTKPLDLKDFMAVVDDALGARVAA